MSKKICRKCNQLKDQNDFFKNRKKYDGRACYCKICSTQGIKKWRKNTDYDKRYRKDNRVVLLIGACRNRARQSSLPFNLDDFKKEISVRLNRGVCELTGFPLTSEVNMPNSSSIDRIDSNLGYTYENIRIVCVSVNTALGPWGEKAVEPIIMAWARKSTTQHY